MFLAAQSLELLRISFDDGSCRWWWSVRSDFGGANGDGGGELAGLDHDWCACTYEVRRIDEVPYLMFLGSCDIYGILGTGSAITKVVLLIPLLVFSSLHLPNLHEISYNLST